jgi:DNA-binding HxlR family transcriptional regulator
MFDYGEACPISMATSVLCERWTLQIVRELFLGSTRYSEIQKFIPKISPSLLRNRLRFLEDQGIILRKKAGGQGRFEYYLTPAGKALGPVLTELGRWGMGHANAGMTDKQNTASGLMRDFASAINTDELPSGNTVIQFNLTDVEEAPKRYINIVNGIPQDCPQDLGFEIDVYLTSTLKTMTRVWFGEIEVHNAIKGGLLTIVAAPNYLKNVSRWLRISSFTTDCPKLTSP